MHQSPMAAHPDAASLTLEILSARPKVYAKGARKRMIPWTEHLMQIGDAQDHGPLEIIDAIQKGFTGGAVEQVTTILDLSQSDLARIMDTTEKTIRNMKARKTLDQTASDKLFRLIKAYITAYLLFEDAEEARSWLKESSDALGGAIPLDLLSTSEGEALVHYELAQMQYGHPV